MRESSRKFQVIAPIRNCFGGTLVMGLIMLLVITVLGIAAVGTSQLEIKMAGNAQDKEISFVAAEDARLAAETVAIQLGDALRNPATNFNCGNVGYFAVAATAQTTGCAGLVGNIATHDWANDSIPVTGNRDRYIIEYLGQEQIARPDDPNRGSAALQPARVFRLTVRGIGSNGGLTYLQAFYTRF